MTIRLRKMEEKGNVRADKANDKKAPRRFAKACIITTSIITFGALAAGCGSDTTASDECIPNLAPADCRSVEPIAQGVTTNDQPLQMGNLSLYLVETEEHGGVMNGIFRIEDSCGNVLDTDKIGEGTTKTFVIEGAEYAVTLNALHQSEDGNDWADVTVDLSCPPSDMCLLVSGILNQGEEIPFDGLKVRLDDIGMDSSTALLSILDSSNNILEKLSVAEGQSVSLHYGEYLLVVEEVSLGATYAAKWARVSVYSRNCD